MPKYITKQVWDEFCPYPYAQPYGTVEITEVVPTPKRKTAQRSEAGLAKVSTPKEKTKCKFEYPPEIAALLSGRPSSPRKKKSTLGKPKPTIAPTTISTTEPSTTA